MVSTEKWGADRVLKLNEKLTPPEVLNGENQKTVTTEFFAKLEKEEIEYLLRYGFSLSGMRIKELKEYCISTNFPYFIKSSIAPEMLRWRENNEYASEEQEASAIKVLLEVVSQDYTYGSVDKNMPSMEEKRAGESALFAEEITNEDFHKIFIETQAPLGNQIEKTVIDIQEKIHQTVGMRETGEPVFA
jgi:tRNA(Ile)-lysidine synthase TilS/MesJ